MPLLKTINRTFILFAIAAFLFACGGGGSSSDDAEEVLETLLEDEEESTGRNVALSSNGATVTSTFSGNETFVIDGDTTTDNFWSAGANDDSVTIDLQQVYDLDEIIIRNDGMTGSSFFSVELSNDGTTFREIDIFDECSTLRLGSVFTCSLIDEARYVRLTILTTLIDIEIHEIEVIEF